MDNKTSHRQGVIIGTAGHVDHGKTTLVKALTGMDTDRLPAEKKRGLSIELGFAHMELPGAVRCALVDVPGHERFIKNMLAGVTGIELVLFCIAADDGVMPQTREHLEIVHLIGVRKGLFVITKIDLAAPGRVSEVERDVRRLISKTALRGSEIIAASAATGEGMDEVKAGIARLCQGLPPLGPKGLLRLPVDRSFSMRGFGCVVTGTVAEGVLKRSEGVFLYPQGVELRVRGLESLHSPVETVEKGERAAVNLSGISAGEVRRGDTLVSPALWQRMRGRGGRGGWRGVSVLDCAVEFLESMPRPFKSGGVLRLHHLTAEREARVRLAAGREAQPGERLHVRIRLKEPLLVMRGDRFILRDTSINRTVAGGVALMPYFSGRCVRRPGEADFAALEAGGGLKGVLACIIPENGPGIDAGELSLMLDTDYEMLDGLLSAETGGFFFTLGGRVVARAGFDLVRKTALDEFSSFHRERPGEAGLSAGELAGRVLRALAGRVKKSAVDGYFSGGLLDMLVEDGRGPVKREGALFSLAAHTPRASGADRVIEDAILEALGGGGEGFEALRLEDLKKRFSSTELDTALGRLVRRGEAVKIRQGVYLSGHAVTLARKRLEEHLGRDPGDPWIKAAEFRDLLGCGRRLAIELLEHFDRERVTLRKGDLRTLR